MCKFLYDQDNKPLPETQDWFAFSESIFRDLEQNPEKYDGIDLVFIDVLPTDIVLSTSYGRGDMQAILRGDKIIYNGFEDLYASRVDNYKFC